MSQPVTLPADTVRQYTIDLHGQDADCREWLTSDGMAMVITHPSGDRADDLVTFSAAKSEFDAKHNLNYATCIARQLYQRWHTTDGRIREHYTDIPGRGPRRFLRRGNLQAALDQAQSDQDAIPILLEGLHRYVIRIHEVDDDRDNDELNVAAIVQEFGSEYAITYQVFQTRTRKKQWLTEGNC